MYYDVMELQDLLTSVGGVEALIDEFEALQPYKLDDYQRESARIIVNELRGILTAFPTGAGKTIVAEFSIWLAKKLGKRAIFTNPLKALSNEKMDEWREKYKDWEVVRDTGDVDRSKKTEQYYKNFTVLITTNERLESILRKKKWINIVFPNVLFVIFDEIHLLGSKGRGSSVEATIIAIKLMREKNIIEDVKFIGLSATLPNSGEFGEWLGTPQLVLPPEMRPVPLFHQYETPTYETTTVRRTTDKMEQVHDFIEKHDTENFLIFVSSRRRCLEIGWSVANEIKKMSRPQWQYRGDDETLMKHLMARGVAWHNAGLSEEKRKFVENSFKGGKIRVLIATPTLSQGMNLPARRVIMFDLARWNGLLSRHDDLEHYEIQQQAGRAGRRGYDDRGDTHYLGTEHELSVAEESVENPYNMYSVLHEKLDDKILALYVSEVAKSKEDVLNIINNSFGALQGSVTPEMVKTTIDFLNQRGFSKEYANNKVYPTKLGKSISARYLLPRSVLAVHESFDKLIEKTPVLDPSNGFHLRDTLVSILKVPEILEGINYHDEMDEELVNATINMLYEKDEHNFETIILPHYTPEGVVMVDDTMALYKLIGVAYGSYFKKQKVRHYTIGSESEARFLITQWIENARMITGFYDTTNDIKKQVFNKILNSIKNGKPLKIVKDQMSLGNESDLDSMFDNLVADQ